MSTKTESVWDYPRPPALERTDRRLRVLWVDPAGDPSTPLVIADTTKAFRVLETSHPPTYYLPPDDVNTSLISRSNARQTMCEWKGRAKYWDLTLPQQEQAIRGKVWTYESPTERFKDIKGFFSFYASPWTCMVDEEVVQPQAGDFYGGWRTGDITGGPKGMKGGPGTFGW